MCCIFPGNDYLHDITSHKHYTIRMDMEDFEGITKYAEYSYFAVADETDKYRLSLGAYSGTTGGCLSVCLSVCLWCFMYDRIVCRSGLCKVTQGSF